MNLAISVAFALREAIVSSREDSGYSRREWFNVGEAILDNTINRQLIQLIGNTIQYNRQQCKATQSNTIDTIHCNKIQCSKIQYNTVKYNKVQ